MVLGKGVTQTVNWLVTIVVIRILTPADYGLMAMAMVLIAMAQMLSDMGLHQALVQAKDLPQKSASQVFTLLLLLNLSIFLSLYMAAPFVARGFDEEALTEVLRLSALQFPILALQSVPTAMLARKMDFRTKALIEAATGIVNSIVTIILALLDYGVWSLVIGNLVAILVRGFLFMSVEKVFYRPTLDFRGFSHMFSFGGYIMLSGFLHFVQMKSADLLVGKTLGKDELGIYSVSNRLATLPMQKITGILNQIGFAAFSKIQNDMEVLRENYLRMQSILCFFAFPVFWGIASVTDSLVTVLLGEKWLATIIPLQLIALAAPLRMVFNSTKSALNGIGNAKLVFSNMLISACTMPIAFAIGLKWGISGVAAVWVLYYPFLFAFIQARSLAALGIGYVDFLREVIKPVMIALLMLLLLFASNHIMIAHSVPPVFRLASLSMLGAAFYLLVSYWLNRETFNRSRRLVF